MPYKYQTIEEAQTPVGYVFPLDITYASKPVFKFEPILHTYEWDYDEEDRTHYITMINGNYLELKLGFCRFCQKEIKPYKEKFYKKEAESGVYTSIEYSAATQCCNTCAIEQTKKIWINTVNWYVTKRTRCGSLWHGDREVIEWENDRGDTSKEIISFNSDYKEEL